MLKPGAFNIFFEVLAAGGRSLHRSELLVKALGLSKPQVSSRKVTGIGRTLLEDAKYLCFFGFDPRRFRVRLVPWSGLFDGSGVWRHPK